MSRTKDSIIDGSNKPGFNPAVCALRWPGDRASWLEKVWFQVALSEAAMHEGTRNAALAAIERLLGGVK